MDMSKVERQNLYVIWRNRTQLLNHWKLALRHENKHYIDIVNKKAYYEYNKNKGSCYYGEHKYQYSDGRRFEAAV